MKTAIEHIPQRRLWELPIQVPQLFWPLLKRRATLVQSVIRIRQSLTELGSLQSEVYR